MLGLKHTYTGTVGILGAQVKKMLCLIFKLLRLFRGTKCLCCRRSMITQAHGRTGPSKGTSTKRLLATRRHTRRRRRKTLFPVFACFSTQARYRSNLVRPVTCVPRFGSCSCQMGNKDLAGGIQTTVYSTTTDKSLYRQAPASKRRRQANRIESPAHRFAEAPVREPFASSHSFFSLLFLVFRRRKKAR